MRFSEAVEAVNARYVPAVVKYYASHNPDPWQKAHDDLEKLIGISDQETQTPLLERFVQRCTAMIEEFKRTQRPSASLTAADGFALGSQERVDAHLSRRNKWCAKCRKTDNLKIVPIVEGGTEVQILCAACAPRKAGA